MGKKFNIRRSLLFYDIYSRLKNIALSAYKWEGLPDTCNMRFLEDTLFQYGQAVFVNDPNMSFLNLKVTPASTLNVYNEPIAYHAFSTGYDQDFLASECVFIRNNLMNKSTDFTISLYAERIAKIEQAIDVNIQAQKTPILIRCDDKTKHTLEAIYNQYEGDKPVIFGHKALQEKPLDVLLTGSPFVADKLREEKRALWNECLEFLGFNTNPADKKKERLVVSEVDSNNEQIDIQAATMLLCREMACEEINKKFGLSVSVSRRVEEIQIQEKENFDYGEIHN